MFPHLPAPLPLVAACALCSKIIDVINEWEREDDGPALTAGEAKKKKVHEEYKEKRAKEAKAAEAKDVAAKEAAWEEKDRIEKELASASTLASWDEVKEALSELKHELTVDRVCSQGKAPAARARVPSRARLHAPLTRWRRSVSRAAAYRRRGDWR